VGAGVDVAGYPVFAVPVPTVEDAAVRADVEEGRAVVAPRRASVDKILAGDYSGELVSLDGELVEVNSDTRDWRLTLKSDGAVYTATMPKDGKPGEPPPWLEGSYVHVVGVCQQDVDARAEWDRLWVGGQRFQSFRVLMRTNADIAVIRIPSWWTPAHTTAVFGVGLAVTLAFAAWVILLLRRVKQKTKELSLSEERFRNLAHHDALTGAPNRALFHDRATIALEHAKRQGNRVGLLLLDLDHFKPINDNFGHEAGDRVLCAVASRALATVRRSDTVARLGGDEFAVLVSDLRHGAEALIIGAKVLHAVCQPISFGLQELPVSASVGVAVYPDDGQDIVELLRNADAAMYRSKNKARGGVARYQSELPVMKDIEGGTSAVEVPGRK
jgi:diguanylate cyclase (GGDEF)-like protein